MTVLLITSSCATAGIFKSKQDSITLGIGVTAGLAADCVGLFLWRQANNSFLQDSYQITRSAFGGLTVGTTMVIGAYIAQYITAQNIAKSNYQKHELTQKAWDASITSSVAGIVALLGYTAWTTLVGIIIPAEIVKK
jgi:hypothetical protein